MSTTRTLVCIALLAVLIACAAAQTSNAVCTSEFTWVDNSKGQTPCHVSAYLATACETHPVVVDALARGGHYAHPAGSNATACRCNTVYYSTISACAACHNASYTTWTSWKEGCGSPIVAQFPKDIPQDTAIPAWAFLDVTAVNEFDPIAAKAFAANDSPSRRLPPQ
ncbi:hypothetical protein BDW22DRAFT_1358021 [Trametopsis cervina]|nr:hypothetical protein BDW22DRAFT_1358021 [Trametopsis cervina]